MKKFHQKINTKIGKEWENRENVVEMSNTDAWTHHHVEILVYDLPNEQIMVIYIFKIQDSRNFTHHQSFVSSLRAK